MDTHLIQTPIYVCNRQFFLSRQKALYVSGHFSVSRVLSHKLLYIVNCICFTDSDYLRTVFSCHVRVGLVPCSNTLFLWVNTILLR